MEKEASCKKEFDEKNSIHLDFNDPFSTFLAMLEKKNRNLEKRKFKGVQIQNLMDSGQQLNDDQKATASSVREIEANLDLVIELSSAVSLIRAEYIAVISKEKCVAPIQQNGSIPRSDNTIKQLLEVQNNFKKLSESVSKLQDLKVTNEKVLTCNEISKLLLFWKLIAPSQKSEQLNKLKKSMQIYQSFFEKSKKLVNVDIGLTYEDVHTLYHKIKSTLNEIKPQPNLESKKISHVTQELQKVVVMTPEYSTNGVLVEQVERNVYVPSGSSTKQRGDRYGGVNKNQQISEKKDSNEFVDSNNSRIRIVVRDVTEEYRARGRGQDYRGRRHPRSQRGNFSHEIRESTI
ncbi:hypothetical protein MXB_2138 [Myxobolus squamalis]|nr:hypothetical protein MXB_2138 [Myxobolus squamalis]